MYRSHRTILSLALALLFAFPLGYRFAHILKHHLPFAVQHTHHHKHHHACKSKENIPSNINLVEYEAECPVVAYEFAIFDIHFIPKFTSNFIVPDIYFVLPEQKGSNKYKGKLFQLRAPPFCV